MTRRRHLLKSIPVIGLAGCLATDDGDPRSTEAPTTSGPRSTGAAADGRTAESSTTAGEGRPDPVPVEPGEVETFADPEAWDVLEGTATVAGACSEDSGASCLRLERGPKRTRLARRFERPLDLTGVHPSATLTASEDTYPRIQLFDVDGHELRLRAPVRGGLAHQPFNFGVESVVGEPDLSRIVEVRFNQSGSSTVWLGQVAFHEPLPPTVLVAFDDQYLSNTPEGPSHLEEFGYSATLFVNTGPVGGEDDLTRDQLEALKRAGWDVCNYTVDHADLLALDEEGQRQQIVGGRRWLILNGFETGADYFTYPYSHYDQTTLDIVDRWHRLAFAGGFPATGAVPNRLLVPRVTVDGVEEARRMIDLTARFGGVTCLYYQDVGTIGELGFRRTVEYLHQREAAGDIDVATASDLARLIES